MSRDPPVVANLLRLSGDQDRSFGTSLRRPLETIVRQTVARLRKSEPKAWTCLCDSAHDAPICDADRPTKGIHGLCGCRSAAP